MGPGAKPTWPRTLWIEHLRCAKPHGLPFVYVVPPSLPPPPRYPPGDRAIINPISQMRKLRLREGKPPAQGYTVRLRLPGSSRENERETQSWGNSSRFAGVGRGETDVGTEDLSQVSHHSRADVLPLPTCSLQTALVSSYRTKNILE